MQDLCACRTAALGGHLYRGPQCHQEHYQYHSCQNRHCPKCQHEQVDRWLEQQRALLLPVVYFLATFTLPRGLRSLARSHQKVVYALFFRASQRALQTLAADPRYVGGTLGLMGVLQTWTRDLRYHPHVHYLIPGGGLAPDDHTWRPARSHYLLPEKPLAQLFRAKVRDLLKTAGLFAQVPAEVWHQAWVVDILAVGSGEAALKYLAPYVFRVAISHRNLLALQDGSVTFRFRHTPHQDHPDRDTPRRDVHRPLPATRAAPRLPEGADLRPPAPHAAPPLRGCQRASAGRQPAEDPPLLRLPCRSAPPRSSGPGALSPLRLRAAAHLRDPGTARTSVMRPLPLSPSHYPVQAHLARRATANPYPRRARRDSLALGDPPGASLSALHHTPLAPECATCPA